MGPRCMRGVLALSVALVAIALAPAAVLARCDRANGAAARSAAPFRFAAPVSSDIGANEMVALVDVTGDGVLDVLACGDAGVSVGAATGKGRFGPPASLLSGRAVQDVVLRDVTGDGVGDLVAASDGQIRVLPGLPSGGFGSAVASQATTGTASLDAGDVNGDGKADVVESFSGGHSRGLSLQLGAGDGTFGAPAAIATPYESFGPTLVDLDGDGRLDLVVYVNEFEEEYGAGVLLGDGKGGFGAMTTYNVGRGLEPADIEVGDMNGDDVPDLVVDMVLEGDTDLGILLGNGDGTFRVAGKSSVWSFHPASYADEYFSIALGDLDGDGKTDVAAARRRAIMVVRCDGSGGFLKTKRITLKDLKYPGVFAGDLDDDGLPDLVSSYSGWVHARLNLTR